MKFSLKNIEVEFGGWSLEFKRIKEGAYMSYVMRSGLIKRDSIINRDGEVAIDTNQFQANELADFMELEESFLASQLVSAKNEDEVAETQDQKALLINWLLTQDDFKVWKDGWFNGQKKT